MYLCNLLGPLCNRYRFEDGSRIRWSSRESITLSAMARRFTLGVSTTVGAGYEFVIPEGVTASDRHELVQKIDEYCRSKRIERCRIAR